MKKKLMFSLIIVVALVIVTGCNNKEKEDSLKGRWVSENENYYLISDGKGHYDVKTDEEDYVSAIYSISKNKVTFYDEGRDVLAICKLNSNELDCTEKYNYATKYVRVSN